MAELLILLTIILLLFGAKKVPQLSRSLGQGIRDFRKGMAEAESDADDDDPAEVQARKNKDAKKEYPSEAASSGASDARRGDDTPLAGQKKP